MVFRIARVRVDGLWCPILATRETAKERIAELMEYAEVEWDLCR